MTTYPDPSQISSVALGAHMREVHGRGSSYVPFARFAMDSWHSGDHEMHPERMTPHEHEVTA